MVNAHAFSHLVSEDGGVHWRRLTDALVPTPGSPYDVSTDGFDSGGAAEERYQHSGADENNVNSSKQEDRRGKAPRHTTTRV